MKRVRHSLPALFLYSVLHLIICTLKIKIKFIFSLDEKYF